MQPFSSKNYEEYHALIDYAEKAGYEVFKTGARNDDILKRQSNPQTSKTK